MAPHLEKSITITVLNENGETLPGVNVVIQGTSQGGITDVNGKLSLTVPDNAVLLVSYVGYETQRLTVGNQTNYTVNLRPNQDQLEELVVIGSRNQNRTVIESPVPVDIINMTDIVKDAPEDRGCSDSQLCGTFL